MPRYVEGEPRTQATLFPDRIEDYIDENNPVRAIEAFVDGLDLEELEKNRKNRGRIGSHLES